MPIDTILLKSAHDDLYFRFKCPFCGSEFLRRVRSEAVRHGYYINKPIGFGANEELLKERYEPKAGPITECITCRMNIGTEEKPVRYDVNGFKD